MRLSEYTDYTLRVLMYCAEHPERRVTIAEIAEHHSASKSHLMKIVNDLAQQGVLDTLRGRGGGVRLLKRPEDISIGDIVRTSETDFRLVECFDALTNKCLLSPECALRHVLANALDAYFKKLDTVTLADIAMPPPESGTARKASQRRRPVQAPVAMPVSVRSRSRPA